MTYNKYLTLVVILVSVIVLMATDIFLPSLPTIAIDFGAKEEVIRFSIPIFLLGSFLSALILGVLSDHFGRKCTMVMGLSLFAVGTLLCAISTSSHIFLMSRFLQGLGSTVSPVVGWAIIQDIYKGDASAKIIAWLGGIVSLSPMVAPGLGGVIHVAFGWRANFYVILGLSIVAFGLMLFTKDTATLSPSRGSLSFMTTFKTYKRILSDKRFLAFVFLFASLQCGVWSFLTLIPFYYENRLGLSPDRLGLYLSGSSFFFILGSLMTPWFLKQTTVLRTLSIGLISALLGGILLLCTHFFAPSLPIVVVVAISVYTFGSAIVWGPSTSRALQCFDESRGAASGVRTLILMGTFSLGGTVGSLLDHSSLLPISLVLIIVASVALVMQRSLRRSEISY